MYNNREIITIVLSNLEKRKESLGLFFQIGMVFV